MPYRETSDRWEYNQEEIAEELQSFSESNWGITSFAEVGPLSDTQNGGFGFIIRCDDKYFTVVVNNHPDPSLAAKTLSGEENA